jgi:hypothetical protein
LIGGVVVAGAVLLIPTLVIAPAQEPIALAITQVLVCGVLLGVGRQGIDVLALRLFAASMALLIGGIYGDLQQQQGLVCAGLTSCAQLIVLLALSLGVFGTVVLAVVAIPTTLLLSRRVASLRPELPWSRVPKPKTWEGWVLLVLLLMISLPILLGIPFPA